MDKDRCFGVGIPRRRDGMGLKLIVSLRDMNLGNPETSVETTGPEQFWLSEPDRCKRYW